ncbi:unnamed protein product [Mytilus coruscus]|uniref:Uncharacterized protein n=1 Tax=Mytilus coruscus TaxID=42192 RepID=A0A6J8EWA7_MYTCO|nr:unnamed protein product [Mytilus coruscus]
MLLFEKFIQTGLIRIKDICYEFMPGFFTSNSIDEIIKQKFPDEKTEQIKTAFERIIRCIPEQWKELLKSENPLNVEITPIVKICLDNDREIHLRSAVTKLFYSLLLSKFFETPCAEKHWAEQYPSLNFKSLYLVVNQSCLPPDCHCLNYRIVHRAIFTLEKLVRIGQADTGSCKT